MAKSIVKHGRKNARLGGAMRGLEGVAEVKEPISMVAVHDGSGVLDLGPIHLRRAKGID
jgi:hypothetical protein